MDTNVLRRLGWILHYFSVCEIMKGYKNIFLMMWQTIYNFTILLLSNNLVLYNMGHMHKMHIQTQVVNRQVEYGLSE